MRIGSYLREGIQRIAEPRAWTVAMQTMPSLSRTSATGYGSGVIHSRATLGRVLSNGTHASVTNVATQGVAD
jgi:hypothetical protein